MSGRVVTWFVVRAYDLGLMDRGVTGGVFFVQAEDGIRDAQESRGLGDVYKRQVIHHVATCCTSFCQRCFSPANRTILFAPCWLCVLSLIHI